MKPFSLILSTAACVLLSAISLAGPAEETSGEGWRDAVEKPYTALFVFRGGFNGSGELSVQVAGITNSFNNGGGWGCGEAGWEDTEWEEVSLELDKTYVCTVMGEDAYGVSAEIKRVPLHTILDRGGPQDNQFNLYKLYIKNRETGLWEKLCPENQPYWTVEEDNEFCHTKTLIFEVQLRRDYGARPVNRPGLKSLEGDEEPEVWTSESGGVAAGSAPGDENALRISAPRNGDQWSMTRNWDVSLGRLWSGGSAGRIRLQGNTLATNDFVRKAMVYISPTWDTNEVQVQTSLADTNEIFQIRAPQALVIATNTASMTFEMRFYLPSAIVSQDTNGYYSIGTNIAFVTWRVDSPASSTNSYRITEIRPWLTNYSTLTYTNASNLWTLVRGSGADTRIETRTITITTSTNGATITTNRLELQEIKNSSGLVATRNSELFTSKPWAQFELTTITNDPGGDNLVTSFTYNEDSELEGAYRQMSSTTWPDGYWEIRGYYEEDTIPWLEGESGRLHHKITPWKDTPITWNTNDWIYCHMAAYSWDDSVAPGAYTLIKKHYDNYEDWESGSGGGSMGRTYIEELKYVELCQDTTQLMESFQLGSDEHYGEFVDTINFTLDAGPLAGQLSARTDWINVKDTYDYIYGHYNPTNRAFTVDTNGIDTKQIVYHGSETGADGGDFIATRESTNDISEIYLKPF